MHGHPEERAARCVTSDVELENPWDAVQNDAEAIVPASRIREYPAVVYMPVFIGTGSPRILPIIRPSTP